MPNILTLTVGLPRSGKSTWAMETGLPVVNPDSVRLAIHGHAFIPDAEPLVWTIARYMVKALFLAGHKEVIVDATNYTRKRREDWKSSLWVRRYKAFGTVKEECIRRCHTPENNRPDLVPVIERMAESFEVVQPDEWDEVEGQNA